MLKIVAFTTFAFVVFREPANLQAKDKGGVDCFAWLAGVRGLMVVPVHFLTGDLGRPLTFLNASSTLFELCNPEITRLGHRKVGID